jgi:hypothetical protein
MFKFVFDIDRKKIISFPGQDLSGYRFLVPSNYLEDATKKAKQQTLNIYTFNNSIVNKMLSFCSREMNNEELNSPFLVYQDQFTDKELELLESYGIITEQKRGYVLSYENNISTIYALFNDIKGVS